MRKEMYIRLTMDEALDSLKQINGYIEHARRTNMEGIGYSSECKICGNSDYDKEIAEQVNMALLTGQSPAQVATWTGFERGAIFRHRTHLIKGFWTFGMGAKIAADGHWLTFPKDGTFEQRIDWYRGRFQFLAYMAEQAKDYKEQRVCLRDAKDCDRAIELVQRMDAGGVKHALDVPDDVYAKIMDAERRRTATIEQRPTVNATAEKVEVKVGEVS